MGWVGVSSVCATSVAFFTILISRVSVNHLDIANLVGFVCGGGSNLALLSGSKLSQVTVVITLPRARYLSAWAQNCCKPVTTDKTYIL
jgi:hypothetical protein